MCPADVRSPSHCLENTPHGQDGNVTDMDDMEWSAANEGVSPTGSATTGETSNTMTEEISTARRYPRREHHPPSRYDDFVRI